MERDSWIKTDTKVKDCVAGKPDVTAVQLDGLRNRVGSEKLLWNDRNHFRFVVIQLQSMSMAEHSETMPQQWVNCPRASEEERGGKRKREGRREEVLQQSSAHF